jgi:hypothetical protein
MKQLTTHHVYGQHDFMNRAAFLEEASEYLVDGALLIRVKMRLSEGSYQSKIYPKLASKEFTDIFDDEETADIAFKVKGDTIKAHKCIIKSQAEDFYIMCEGHSIESPMAIDDVDVIPFRIMIFSLYGGDVFPEEWQKYSESILKAASKYGFDRLKDQADVTGLSSHVVSVRLSRCFRCLRAVECCVRLGHFLVACHLFCSRDHQDISSHLCEISVAK